MIYPASAGSPSSDFRTAVFDKSINLLTKDCGWPANVYNPEPFLTTSLISGVDVNHSKTHPVIIDSTQALPLYYIKDFSFNNCGSFNYCCDHSLKSITYVATRVRDSQNWTTGVLQFDYPNRGMQFLGTQISTILNPNTSELVQIVLTV